MSIKSVTPAFSRPPKYKKIIVGYDGSKNSQRALARAATVASASGASLAVMVVVNTTLMAIGPMTPPVSSEVFDDIINNGKDMLADAMNFVGSTVPAVTGSVQEGNPSKSLLDFAEKEGGDLIVLGRRGISGVERFLLGSVSSTIVSHSKCDVLIVK